MRDPDEERLLFPEGLRQLHHHPFAAPCSHSSRPRPVPEGGTPSRAPSTLTRSTWRRPDDPPGSKPPNNGNRRPPPVRPPGGRTILVDAAGVQERTAPDDARGYRRGPEHRRRGNHDEVPERRRRRVRGGGGTTADRPGRRSTPSPGATTDTRRPRPPDDRRRDLPVRAGHDHRRVHEAPAPVRRRPSAEADPRSRASRAGRPVARLRVPRTAERAEHDLLVDVVLLVARDVERIHDGGGRINTYASRYWARCASAAPGVTVRPARASGEVFTTGAGTPRTTACGSMGTAPRWRLRPDSRPHGGRDPGRVPVVLRSGDRQVRDHRTSLDSASLSSLGLVFEQRLGADQAVREVARRGAPGDITPRPSQSRHRPAPHPSTTRGRDRDGHASASAIGCRCRSGRARVEHSPQSSTWS